MKFLTLDPEKTHSSAPACLYVELGESNWHGKMLNAGGLVLERPEDDYDLAPLDPSFLTNHYGVDSHGGVYPVRRTYTVAEIRVAIPRIAGLFGLKLVPGGLGIGDGKLAWGNQTDRQYFAMGRRQLVFNTNRYGSALEVPPGPVLQFDENGDVLFPMGMVVDCLLRWGELIPEQGRRFTENHPMRGFKDRLSARLSSDSVTFMWARRYGEGYYV